MERSATDRALEPIHERAWRRGHVDDDTSPAPGDLEPLRSFLSLHDHAPGDTDSLPPDTDTVRWWLETNGQIGPESRPRSEDLRWAMSVREALRAKLAEHMGRPRDDRAIAFLNEAAERAGLRLRYGAPEDPPIHVSAGGVRGAIGELLGAAFLAELDGRWERLRFCGDPTCAAVFYDRSKNRSGRWCSMSVCGNRAKVRAFRARQATA